MGTAANPEHMKIGQGQEAIISFIDASQWLAAATR
jgi:hypothetical protein